MIAYLPEIYPDELVYSWFCRYYVHSGCLTHKTALQEILYKRCNNPSKEFIGHLNPEMKSEIQKIYSIDDLIIKHTMYPQYARFIPSDRKKEALYHLEHDFCDAHYLFTILPRIQADSHLKYCPLCVKEDREIYGEAYWHRKHQIRNMIVCPKHKCMLADSEVTAKSEQTFTFCPAENFTSSNKAVITDNQSAIEYSKYLDKIFDTPIDFENDIPLSTVLYVGMSKTKYMKPSGKSRYTKMLADDMKAFYEKIDLKNIASIHQIQKILLGIRFEFSVVCQIAFFLGMKVEELTNPILTIEHIRQEQGSQYIKDRIPIDWIQYDDETAPLLEQIASDIYNGVTSEIGRPERVSEKIIYKELGLSKSRLDNMPKCRVIFNKYTETYEENWARRIIWAYNKLKSDGVPFYWSDIRSLSGVKKKNFESTIPYLQKHTDIATIDAIVALVLSYNKIVKKRG